MRNARWADTNLSMGFIVDVTREVAFEKYCTPHIARVTLKLDPPHSVAKTSYTFIPVRWLCAQHNEKRPRLKNTPIRLVTLNINP